MPSVPVNPNMIVYPSGVLLAICLAAIVPPAPARWSTMTCWPSVSENLSAMIRAMMPVLPPGGKVSTTRQVFMAGPDDEWVEAPTFLRGDLLYITHNGGGCYG